MIIRQTRFFIGIVNVTNYSSIHAHACDVNQDHEDVRVLQDYGDGDANAIYVQELNLPRVNGYDAHQYVDDNGYVP